MRALAVILACFLASGVLCVVNNPSRDVMYRYQDDDGEEISSNERLFVRGLELHHSFNDWMRGYTRDWIATPDTSRHTTRHLEAVDMGLVHARRRYNRKSQNPMNLKRLHALLQSFNIG